MVEKKNPIEHFVLLCSADEGLTQHDGIDRTASTELNQNLKKKEAHQK